MIALSLNYLKNYEFETEVNVVMSDKNAKMNELQTLRGEIVLTKIDYITQLLGFIAKFFFDKLTHCRVVSIMASKKADAVFSQNLPRFFNWLAVRVNIHWNK